MTIELIFLGLDVVVDTEALHLAACNGAFEEAEISVRWTMAALRKNVRAHGSASAIAAVLPAGADAQDQARKDELLAAKDALLRTAILANPPRAWPACLKLVDDALAAGHKLSVLSDMPAPISALLLEQCFGRDLGSKFGVVAGGVDFHGPAGTGPYARALHAMGVEPRAAVLIDAAAPSLRAARAAGIATISLAPAEGATAAHAGANLWCPQLPDLRAMLARTASERAGTPGAERSAWPAPRTA
ncbi:MAG: HAD family hydrolase [Telluria sp.]|nr:HAD family hydrolase [Telluria sp.]